MQKFLSRSRLDSLCKLRCVGYHRRKKFGQELKVHANYRQRKGRNENKAEPFNGVCHTPLSLFCTVFTKTVEKIWNCFQNKDKDRGLGLFRPFQSLSTLKYFMVFFNLNILILHVHINLKSCLTGLRFHNFTWSKQKCSC